MKRFFSLFFIVLFQFIAAAATASVINVPEDRRAIQAAVEAAEDGDTVLVQPGTYRENIDFIGKPITVASLFLTTGDAAYVDSTIIDGNRSGNAVTFETYESNASILCGFTIQNSGEDDKGIYIRRAGPLITDLKVINNPGGGLYGSNSTIHHDLDTLRILNSTFEGNVSEYWGAGLSLHFGYMYLENVHIIGNESGTSGGGLDIFSTTYVLFNSGSIVNNSAIGGGGLYMVCGSRADFYNVTFSENRAENCGGGGNIDGGSRINMYYCLFSNNSADSGGAVGLIGAQGKYFQNVTICDNVADLGDGIYTGESSFNTFLNCIVYGNGDCNIFCDEESSTSISYSDVEGGGDGIDIRDEAELEWGEGNIDLDPLFAEGECNAYLLSEDSPCIDAGDPDSPLDEDGTRADLGAYPCLRYSYVYGRVVDAVDLSPIPNVDVLLSNGASAVTGEGGCYTLTSPFGVYDLSFNFPGYNEAVFRNLEIDVLDSLEISPEMLHPDFRLSKDEVSAGVIQGFKDHAQLSLENNANGRLEWSMEYQTESGETLPPYEIRQSWQIGEAVNDDRLLGAAFAGDRFFVSGRGEESHQIYIANRDGEIIDRFEQPGESRIGMRDLAWDGEYFWSSGELNVYRFDNAGNVAAQFEGPLTPVTAVAWDDEREVLWTSSITSNIIGCTPDGEERFTINRHDSLRIYGLAYFQADPDDCPLYILHKLPEADCMSLSKTDPDNGEIVFVRHFTDSLAADCEGLFITRDYDRYGGWVMLAISNLSRNQGGDRLVVYQLEPNVFYLEIDPTEGIVSAGDNEQVGLTFITQSEEGFVLDFGIHEGSLIFSHNARGGGAVIPISLNVLDPAGLGSEKDKLPEEYSISAVYPNPFNSAAKIDFETPQNSFISLSVYDLSGRLVERLVQGRYRAGRYNAVFDGSDLPSGLYVARLEADAVSVSRKVMLVK